MNILSEQDKNNATVESTETNTVFPESFIVGHVVFFDKLENGDIINIAAIKQLTGGDSFYARPATEKG